MMSMKKEKAKDDKFDIKIQVQYVIPWYTRGAVIPAVTVTAATLWRNEEFLVITFPR